MSSNVPRRVVLTSFRLDDLFIGVGRWFSWFQNSGGNTKSIITLHTAGGFNKDFGVFFPRKWVRSKDDENIYCSTWAGKTKDLAHQPTRIPSVDFQNVFP